MRRQRGFTLIELLVASAVTFITVLAVSAAFLGYTQSFYTQAGIRGGQAALRQTHQLVVRQLRMAGYGMEPPLAFGFPPGPPNWFDDASRNRSDRLVFRMRNPRFNAIAASVSANFITTVSPLTEQLRRGQVLQVVCPGAISWTYVQLKLDADKGLSTVELEPPTGTFPRVNDFTPSCFGTGGGGLPVYVFKVDIYDYSIQLIDDDGNPSSPGRPYLFRRHGIDENDPDSYGEPVAEDIEALRVTFLRDDGSDIVPRPPSVAPSFVPNLLHAAPGYDTPLNHPDRFNDHPANIRAVRVGLVARTSSRDQTAAPGVMSRIPAFGGRPEIVFPEEDKAYGFRRILSEVTVQIRNMRSSELPLPVYTLDSAPTACKGAVPSDDFNCAGG